MHLKLLHESGLPALVGLWIIIYAIGRQAVRLVVVNRGTALFGASLALLGGFVAVNVSAMFGPTAYARHFWLPFAMIGCLWTVRRRELDQSAAEARALTSPPLPARSRDRSSPFRCWRACHGHRPEPATRTRRRFRDRAGARACR